MVYKIQKGSKLHLWLIVHVTYQGLNVENVIEVGKYLYLTIERHDNYYNECSIKTS